MSKVIEEDDVLSEIKALSPYLGGWLREELVSRIMAIPSAEQEPSQVARDIATILENEQDMRVILKNAEVAKCNSARQQRKTGKWILMDDGYVDFFICSECGKQHDYKSYFCPNCGSYNGGKKDV